MNIAGVIINALPGHEQRLREALHALPGVEVHAVAAGRRMVVTVEAMDSRALADRLTEFHNFPGVMSATTVYHHFAEEDEEMPDEIEQA